MAVARPRLSAESSPAGVRGLREPQARDLRMTLPARPGEIPREAFLGRRLFALAPRLVVSGVALAYAVAELLRERPGGVEWSVVGVAVLIAAVAGLLGLTNDRGLALRFRRVLWVYGAGGAIVLATLASIAIHDGGVTSVVYAGICPLATYAGLVSPARWRIVTLAALLLTTVAVQFGAPDAALFDAGIVLMVTAAAWFCGAMVAIAHERTVKIIRRNASHDRETRSLSRRGFMQQLEWAVRSQPGSPGSPGSIALLLIGVEPADDHDEDLLAWIGATVPAVLPDAAEFGRLSDDEFGVLLTELPRHRVEETARDVRRALEVGGRAHVRVGVATSETRAVAAADLFRVADAARVLAFDDPLGVQSLVAGTAEVPRGQAPPTAIPPERPGLRYADVRATGRVPRVAEEDVVGRSIVALSIIAVGVAGIPVVARELLDPGPGFYHQTVRFVGPIWVLLFFALAAATRRWWTRSGGGFDLFLVVVSGTLLAIGLGAASLMTVGLASPIVGAFFVYVVYGSAILSRDRGLLTLVQMLAGWSMVLALGPADVRWIAPFHLALFAGCFVLGSLGRRAIAQTAAVARSRAITDDLTQRPSPPGFRALAEAAFLISATETGTPLAMLVFQIADLRAYNEARGYGAGDELLRAMGDLLEARVPTAAAIGRTSSTEFAVAVAVAGPLEAAGLARDLGDALRELAPVTASSATWPADGATVDALMRAARSATRRSRDVVRRVA